MGFTDCFHSSNHLLMEGALGERLKREYHLRFDGQVAMAKLIYDPAGAAALRELWQGYARIAAAHNLPFMATTLTRRANRERVSLGRCKDTILSDNVRHLKESLADCPAEHYAGGLMGCRGDAYTGEGALSREKARSFHAWQAERFAAAGADFLFAGIMPTLPEAEGMAQAMAETGLPYIISFTIQPDGHLIDGTTISDAIEAIDAAASRPAVCFMANCIHPSHVRTALLQPFNRTQAVQTRFRGVQGNTSPLSYAELDGAEDLKCAEPEDFGRDMAALLEVGDIKIFGGCCGTDHRHMEEVAKRLIE